MNSVARQRLDSCASEKLESLDLSGQDLDADAARELATMLPKWYANNTRPQSALAVSLPKNMLIMLF